MTTSKQVNEALGSFMRSSERLVKSADLTEFWENLEATLTALVQDSSVEKSKQPAIEEAVLKVVRRFAKMSPLRKAELLKMIGQAHSTMSPEDAVKFWQSLGATIDESKTYSDQEKLDAFNSMGRPENPDKGYGRQPLPASSVPLRNDRAAPGVRAPLVKALDEFADVESKDLKDVVDRAKTGLNALEPRDEPVTKEGQRLQSVEFAPDAETEEALRNGTFFSENKETALNKVKGATSLIGSVEEMLSRAENSGVTLT